MPKLEDRDKQVQSIRINRKLVELTEDTGFYLSHLVEACLINFFKLNDNEKVKFLYANDPTKTDLNILTKPDNIAKRAEETARAQLGPEAKRTSIKALIAIGLTMLFLFLISQNDDKNKT